MIQGVEASQDLNWRRYDGGARQVLAFHCTMAHSGAWRGVAGDLADLATVLAPDMLSHGRSPDWDGQGNFQDRLVEQAQAQLASPADLVGHSFGATVALRLALECPGLVRSLVLIEPVLFAVAAADAPDLSQADREKMRPVAEALAAGDTEQAARLFNRLWGALDGPRWADLPPASRQAMMRGVQILLSTDADVYGDRKGVLRPGVLDQLRVPTLILRGSRSPEVMTVICDGLTGRLPSARQIVVDGADHMVPVTHPQVVAQHIRDFWAGLPKG